MLPEFYQFHQPTKVVFGEGMISDFAHELEELKAENYFIVSDHVINDLGWVQTLKQGLQENGFAVTGEYFDVPQDASVQVVETISHMAANSGAQGLIAIGGGSVIDAAKAANFLFTNGGDLIEDYSGAATLTSPLKPLVVIPTTAGTGSESTLVAVIYDVENHTKLAFSDKYLLPDLAVLDPAVTRSLPPAMTAATGMDALTHAIESYVGVDASPHAQALAGSAIELIFNNIVTATKNGDDLQARGAMLIAANMAGIAFSHSMVGCVHSMSHAVGGIARVAHGVANAILLPHGMEYNFETCKDQFAKLAAIMGVPLTGLSVEEAGRGAIAAVRNLLDQLHNIGALPLHLKEAGVSEESLPAIAAAAVEDGTIVYNPREVIEEEILAHLKNAF